MTVQHPLFLGRLVLPVAVQLFSVLSKPTAKVFPGAPWHDGNYTEVAAGVCVRMRMCVLKKHTIAPFNCRPV